MVNGRVAFFVDGFNVYHSIEDYRQLHKYKWLNLYKLCQTLVPKKCAIAKVYYFTAYTTWDPSKLSRHQRYVRALKTTPVEVVLGKFKEKDVYCRLCKRQFKTVIEKETDVNIAIALLRGGIEDLYDSAIIISGDSDLVPAITQTKLIFPTKQIGVAFPINRKAEELRQISDFSMRLSEQQLRTCQFPDQIELAGGLMLERPVSWS